MKAEPVLIRLGELAGFEISCATKHCWKTTCWRRQSVIIQWQHGIPGIVFYVDFSAGSGLQRRRGHGRGVSKSLVNKQLQGVMHVIQR